MFKGSLGSRRTGGHYPLKMILPNNFPMAPPRIYFDMQLPMEVVQQLAYIGQQNMVSIPYTQQWQPTSNLTQLIQFLAPQVDA